MHVEQREDAWWIVDPPEDVEEMGPYGTRREAEEEQRGVARFLRHEGKLDFVTTSGRNPC